MTEQPDRGKRTDARSRAVQSLIEKFGDQIELCRQPPASLTRWPIARSLRSDHQRPPACRRMPRETEQRLREAGSREWIARNTA